MASLQYNKNNGTFSIYLPKIWAEIHGFKKGQKFEPVYGKAGEITLRPVKGGKRA